MTTAGRVSPSVVVVTGLPFAGFFYDVLLALGAHIPQQDLPDVALAPAGVLSIAAA